jgi:hypothetical protein
VAYDIHIRTTDGGVQYPNALSYSVEDQILRVQVGEDEIYFSPHYWQQYVVDPEADDPLDLGLDELEEDEDEDQYEDEVEDE